MLAHSQIANGKQLKSKLQRTYVFSKIYCDIEQDCALRIHLHSLPGSSVREIRETSVMQMRRETVRKR